MTVIGIIILSLLFSAFFSGVEIAYISSNKLHIEVENKKGNLAYQIVSYLVKNPSRFIASMLVGNNVALVIYGIFMSEIINSYLNFIENDYLLLSIQTILSGIVILVLAEFLPKAIFKSNSNRFLEVFVIPSSFFYFLFYPVVTLMTRISDFIMKYIMQTSAVENRTAFDKVDLDSYLKERSESSRDEEELNTEIQIFRNAMEFSKQKAREFMIPRTEMIALDASSSIEVLKTKFIESNLSKILIYKGSIHNVIGYVHSFELFKKPANIRSILRPISFIPESVTANEILRLLIRERRSIAVVLDEFGETSGLVTVEDIIEELFGEIDDEHDLGELIEKKIDKNIYLFSARHEIDYLNNKYNLQLPESEKYSTLGGLVLNHLESIPDKGDELRLEPYVFKMEGVSNSKIEVIRLTEIEN